MEYLKVPNAESYCEIVSYEKREGGREREREGKRAYSWMFKTIATFLCFILVLFKNIGK